MTNFVIYNFSACLGAMLGEEMSFVLKKFISIWLSPLMMGLVLFALGLFFLFTQRMKRAKVTLIVSFVWLFVIGYSPFANFILAPLETQYPRLTHYESTNIKYILLTGGDFDGRAYEAVKLYHRLYGAKIITSGFLDSEGELSEASINARKLISLGVAKQDIVMQHHSRDTQEEAQYIKEIVGDDWFILVTSAYHMPRAVSDFRQAGLNPIPAPTDFLARPINLLTGPNGYEAMKTERAFHEYFGLIWQFIKRQYTSSTENTRSQNSAS